MHVLCEEQPHARKKYERIFDTIHRIAQLPAQASNSEIIGDFHDRKVGQADRRDPSFFHCCEEGGKLGLLLNLTGRHAHSALGPDTDQRIAVIARHGLGRHGFRGRAVEGRELMRGRRRNCVRILGALIVRDHLRGQRCETKDQHHEASREREDAGARE